MGSVDIPPFMKERMKQDIQANKSDIPPFLQKKNGGEEDTSTLEVGADGQLDESVPTTSQLPLQEDIKLPTSFDLSFTKKPVVNIAGVNVGINAPIQDISPIPEVANQQTLAEQLQARINTKTYTPEDINVVAESMKVSLPAASAYMKGDVGTGTVIHFNDVKAVKKEELKARIERVNSELGLADTYEEVFSSPDLAGAYINKIETLYESKAKQEADASTLKAQEDNPVLFSLGNIYVDKSQSRKTLNAAQQIKGIVSNEIIEKISEDTTLTTDQKVQKIYSLVDSRDKANIKKAIDQRLSPLRYMIDVATGGKTSEDIDLLNANKAGIEFKLNRTIGEKINYNEALKRSITEEYLAKIESQEISAEDETAKSYYAKRIADVESENNGLSMQLSSEKALYEKYPVLYKSAIANSVNEYNAIKSGNVVGFEDGGYEGVSLNEHLAAQGFDVKDQKVQDFLDGDNFKDYSFFGRPLKNISEVFTNTGKSIADFTPLRDKADILSEKRKAELFPTQVGATDELKLTTSASTAQNIANTTGQVLGQGLLQIGTAGIGRLAGLTKVAAANAAFLTSGSLVSYDSHLKESYDLPIETDAGRVAYAAINSGFEGAIEGLFPEAKLFQIPGFKDAAVQIAGKLSAGQLTDKLASELLTKAKNNAVNYLVKYGTNISKETAEEGLTSAFNSATKLIIGDPNTNFDKAIEDVKNTVIQTAIGTSLIGGFGAYGDVRKERNVSAKSTIYNAAIYHDEALDAINLGFSQNLYGEYERDAKIAVLNTAREAVNVMDKTEKIEGKTLKRPERELYVANLTAEAVLKGQKQGMDEVGQKAIDEKVSNLQNQRQQILKGEVLIDDNGNITTPTNKPIQSEEATVESAVIIINGKTYEGKNHAEAILKAKNDGQDISNVDRQAEGQFKLSDGSIINREEAKNRFGQDRSELLIPQDEAANQANNEYKKIAPTTETTTPVLEEESGIVVQPPMDIPKPITIGGEETKTETTPVTETTTAPATEKIKVGLNQQGDEFFISTFTQGEGGFNQKVDLTTEERKELTAIEADQELDGASAETAQRRKDLAEKIIERNGLSDKVTAGGETTQPPTVESEEVKDNKNELELINKLTDEGSNEWGYLWRGDVVTQGNRGGIQSPHEMIANDALGTIKTLIEDFNDLKGLSKVDGKEWGSWNEVAEDLISKSLSTDKTLRHKYDEGKDKYDTDVISSDAIKIAKEVTSVVDFDKAVENLSKGTKEAVKNSLKQQEKSENKPITSQKNKPVESEEVNQPITRESSFAAFAEAFPKIMKDALEEQKPYRDAFLKRKNLTDEQYKNLSISEKESIQNEWVKSNEFKEMNDYIDSKSENKPTQNEEAKATEVETAASDNIPPTTDISEAAIPQADGTGIIHAATAETREEFGLPEYGKEAQTFEQWDAEADVRIKNGEMPALLKKLTEGDQPSAVEVRMMGKYIAFLKGVASRTKSNEDIAKLHEAIKLSDSIGGTENARGLVARKGLFLDEGTLADFFQNEMEAAKVDVLTDEQKAMVEKEHAEIAEAQKKWDEERDRLNKKIKDLEAEQAINKNKSTKKQTSSTKKTHEDFVKERDAIVQHLKDKLRQARSGTNVTVIPYAADLFAAAPDVARLVKSLVEEGITKLADVIDNIHEVLKGGIPDVTKDDVRDLVAGVYNAPQKTKSQVAKDLFELKMEAKLINQLIDLQNGVQPQTNQQQIKYNQQIKDLREQIAKFRKENITDEDKLNALKSRYASEIKKVEEQLRTGNFLTPQQKVPIKLDKAALDAKDKLIKLKNERQLRILKEQYKNRSATEKNLNIAANIFNIPRALQTTLDFSAVLRQGLIPSISHPILAFQAGRQMFKSAWTQKEYDRWFSDLEESPQYNLMKESGLALTDNTSPDMTLREEVFMSNLAEKIPIVGQQLKTPFGTIPGANLIKKSERAYAAYINKLRVDLFSRMAEAMTERGLTFENSPKQFKQMAEYINNATGRGNLGKFLNSSAPLWNGLFFSPRLIASRLNMLTYFAQPRFWRTAPIEVRKAYFSDMAKFIGVGVAVLALAKYGGDDEDKEKKLTVELDPRSSDFGKIRQGNTRWDIWGGFQPFLRVAAQVYSGERKSTNTGEIYDITGDGPFSQNRGDVLLAFARGKLAPVPGMAIDLFSRRTAIGDKILLDKVGAANEGDKEITIDRYMKEHLLPLTYTGVKEAMEEKGIKSLFTVGIPSVFGIGTQTYDPTVSKANVITVYKNGKKRDSTPEEFEKYQKEKGETKNKLLEKYQKSGVYINKYGDVTTEVTSKKRKYETLTKEEKEDLEGAISRRASYMAKKKLHLNQK